MSPIASDTEPTRPAPGRADAAAFAALTELVAAGGVFVLTGAGLSTDSGIPDYRGRDGVRRVMPMQFGEFTATSAARQRYWARSYVGWSRFRTARPNAGHHAVTALQRLGLLRALVTQNVDGLHGEARAENVVELHGSLAEVVCLQCGDRSARGALQERMDADNPGFTAYVQAVVAEGSQVSSQIRPDGDIVLADAAVGEFVLPRCLVCGADRLKPDVVFFGESVPTARVERCLGALSASRSVLVLGSSLAVMSGYRFVRKAAAERIPVAILTHGWSRGDEQASLKLDLPLSLTLTRLAQAVAPPR